MKKDTTETKLCLDFVSYINFLESVGKMIPCVWFKIANEVSGGHPAYGALLKRMGKKNGVADYVFLSKDSSVFLEFKSKKGKQSLSQVEFEKSCSRAQIPYFVCSTLEGAVEKLKEYSFILE